MKKIFLFTLFALTAILALAQKETFDLTTYSVPKGWKKTRKENAVQFVRQNNTTGEYCMMILLKSVASAGNSKKDFDNSWETVIKGMAANTSDPEMQRAAQENGWENQSGYSAFESDGNKGVVILSSTSGYQRLINLVIMTNCDTYQTDINKFMESFSFKKPSPQVAPKTPNNPEIKPVAPAPLNDGYAFSITNWDDGWTSVIKADWVEVTKGGVKVLLHYNSPNNIKDAWNSLIPPRYNITNPVVEDYGTPTWQGMNYYIIGANATEKSTGKKVYVFVFSGPGGYCLEAVADNYEVLKKELATVKVEKVIYDPSQSTTTINWAKTNDLFTKNRFAISPKDLTGTWYYGDTVKTGNSSNYSAAATNMISISTHQISFTASGQYQYKAGDGSGFNTNSSNVKVIYSNYQGKFSASNWEVSLQNTKYNSYFYAVKNGRILVMQKSTDRPMYLKRIK